MDTEANLGRIAQSLHEISQSLATIAYVLESSQLGVKIEA